MPLRLMEIESSPEVLNNYLKELGVPAKWGFIDILAVDDGSVTFVPLPCLGFIVLFPVTDNYKEYLSDKENMLEDVQEDIEDDVYFLKQTIPNACGTVALLHLLGNNETRIQFAKDSIIMRFLNLTKDMEPSIRGSQLECAVDMLDLHENQALQGQSMMTDDESDKLHYTVLVRVGDKLVELDGRKSVPIVHCSTTEKSFVYDAFRIIRRLMQVDPSNMKFNVMAFGNMFADGAPSPPKSPTATLVPPEATTPAPVPPESPPQSPSTLEMDFDAIAADMEDADKEATENQDCVMEVLSNMADLAAERANPRSGADNNVDLN